MAVGNGGARQDEEVADGPNDPGTGKAGSGDDDEEPDVRFSYANERTFLAWIRTSLGLVTAGLAITQLLPPFHLAGGRKLIGLPLIALGVVVALYSFRNWQENERAMRRGRALPKSVLPQISAVVVSIVAVIGLVLVIWGGSAK
jgi:putative membrane protein